MLKIFLLHIPQISLIIWDISLQRKNLYLFHALRIERSVSACFSKIAILPIYFSNAKWIYLSLESLMIELCLHIKVYLDYFQEDRNMPNLENRRVLHFEFYCQKLLRLYHNTYILLFCRDLSTKPYRGLWFNWTHLPLFQKISVNIYTNFFLSSGGYNFKINNLKDKWYAECEFISCWTIWRLPHYNTSITFGTGG